MIGIIGVIAFLTVLALSMLITGLATSALAMTGLSREAARFQARSAFTGTGFTTKEKKKTNFEVHILSNFNSSLFTVYFQHKVFRQPQIFPTQLSRFLFLFLPYIFIPELVSLHQDLNNSPVALVKIN